MNDKISIPGPVAQDKDWARSARADLLMPALALGSVVCLDFGGVQIATQSFVHALLSEATRIHGEAGLARIEFRACSEQVKQAIQTVVTYSIRARELAADMTAHQDVIRSADVPQADDLQKIRRVVETLADGPTPMDLIASLLGYSVRHTYYRASAARVLDLLHLASGIAVITGRGIKLVTTTPKSLAEQELLKDAVASSPVLRQIAPGLLGRREPKSAEIIKRLTAVAHLSPSTAARRVQCLLSWRRQLLEQQLVLPGSVIGSPKPRPP
jgi:hypothetical protein